MKVALFCLLCLIMGGNSGYHKGVQFEKNLTWKELLRKAKLENKYIFIDCVATWCLPCKKMDVEVYTDSLLAIYVNSDFISVKVQLDTSKNDNDQIRKWYSDASTIQKKYKVTVVPTFLFFSPDGQIVHRDIGYKNVSDFQDVIRNAADSCRQFYTLLENYRNNKKDYSVMQYLANAATALKENDLAKKIGRDYINNFLLKHNAANILTKEKISFIRSYMNSNDKLAFDLFVKKETVIDSIMEAPNYTRAAINSVIGNYEINPCLYRNGNLNEPITANPNWNKMNYDLAKKYGKHVAYQVIIDAKILWFKSHKQWSNMIEQYIDKFENLGIDTVGTIAKVNFNNIIWYDFFLRTKDTSILLKASRWMKVLVNSPKLIDHELFPGWVDTYANLLYKAGNKKEALIWQEKAVMLAPNDKNIRETFYKMIRGERTW